MINNHGDTTRAELIELLRRVANLPPKRKPSLADEVTRLSDTTVDILLCVYDDGPLMATDIAETLDKQLKDVCQYLNRLAERGLVEVGEKKRWKQPRDWWCTPHGCEVVEAYVEQLKRGKAS